MELIAKTTHAGKTSEAIMIASQMEGNTLFITNEDCPHALTDRINKMGTSGKVYVSHQRTAIAVENTIIGWSVRGVQFDTIVLDVNFGITHQEWFKLAQQLEDAGIYVVVTQQVVRHGVKSKETLIATQR